MIIHEDLEGDDLYITVSSTGNIWITCNENDASITELYFNKSSIKRIIEDLQEKLKEVETNE